MSTQYGNHFAPRSLLDLIKLARASDTGCWTHHFQGSHGRNFFLGVDTRKSHRYVYTLGSGLVEVDFLTRQAAARMIATEV
jgi:hypothetical protein